MSESARSENVQSENVQSQSSKPNKGKPEAGTSERERPLRLRRGLALLTTRTPGLYLIGDRTRLIALRSRLEVTMVQQLTAGRAFSAVEQLIPQREDLAERELSKQAFSRLRIAGLTSKSQPFLALPHRHRTTPVARDLASQLIIQRSAPELAECEWSERDDDGGASTLARRASAQILISGRSRIATLLARLLPQSGVGSVDFADRFLHPEISPMDIGIGDIGVRDIGNNFYQHQSATSAEIALFPTPPAPPSGTLESERLAIVSPPTLIIHCGELGIEDQVDWMVAGQPHLAITAVIGREVAISPIVLPGLTPCLRCMELYELDHYGCSRFERIPLTELPESSFVASHFIAALVASMVLNFIDAPEARSPGVGEITYINSQQLRAPQVVAIDRHPLCGCSTTPISRVAP